MKWSVEARVPFLDHRLVKALNSIDFQDKSGPNRKKDKKILKKIASEILPKQILNRQKQGFASPMKTYKRNLVKKLEVNSYHYNNIKLETLDPHTLYVLLNYQILNKYYK
jgi:asparagine synthetase B (glutamine-hydrolysing)